MDGTSLDICFMTCFFLLLHMLWIFSLLSRIFPFDQNLSLRNDCLVFFMWLKHYNNQYSNDGLAYNLKGDVGETSHIREKTKVMTVDIGI